MLNQIVACRPVHFHIDCDVLNPGLFQTDYHEPEGLTLAQLEDLATALVRNFEILGVEIAEWEGPGTHQPDDLLSAFAPLRKELDSLTLRCTDVAPAPRAADVAVAGSPYRARGGRCAPDFKHLCSRLRKLTRSTIYRAVGRADKRES